MTHYLAMRCLKTSDDCCDRFRVLDASPIIHDPIRCLLFGRTAKFTNDDDSFCIFVMLKNFQGIDKIGSRKHVTPDSNTKTLAEASSGQRSDRLIGESAGLCHNANVARGEGGQWLEPDSASTNS